MRFSNSVRHVRCMFKNSVSVIMGVSFTSLLGACATHHCDPTGASASHCRSVKMHVWTGEAFEEDKNFYYRKSEQTGADVAHIPPTDLAGQVLKGQKEYYTVWSRDGQAMKAIFVKRPASF